MFLEFVNRLRQEKIIDLINFSVYNSSPTIDRVKIEGLWGKYVDPLENCIKVIALKENHVVNTFFINNFELHMYQGGYYNDKLREYLASIFEEEYIEALRYYYDEQIKMLQNKLGKSRK